MKRVGKLEDYNLIKGSLDNSIKEDNKVLLVKGNIKDKDIEIYQRQDDTSLVNICKGSSGEDSGNKFHYKISWNSEADTGFDSEDPMNTSYETLCNILSERLFDRWLQLYFRDSEDSVRKYVIDLYKYNEGTEEFESIDNDSSVLVIEFRKREKQPYLCTWASNIKINSNVPYAILIKDGLPVIKHSGDALDTPNVAIDKFPIKESEVLVFQFNNTASSVGISSNINITPDFSDGKHTLTDFLVRCLNSGVDYSDINDGYTEQCTKLINKYFKNCSGVTFTMPLSFAIRVLA